MQASDEQEVVAYLRTVYVPAVLADGTLHSPSLMRIVSRGDDEEALSYALAFVVESEEQLARYLGAEGRQHGAALAEHFGERVLGFSTIMEHVAL